MTAAVEANTQAMLSQRDVNRHRYRQLLTRLSAYTRSNYIIGNATSQLSRRSLAMQVQMIQCCQDDARALEQVTTVVQALFAPELLEPFTSVLLNSKAEGSFLNALIVIIHKPDIDLTLCKHYQPISLTMTVTFWKKILVSRIEDVIPLPIKPDQSGFIEEPRGKQNTGTESAGEPPVTQSSSTEDPAAVPSAEPLPSTSADGDSGAASAIPAGTGGTEAPTPAAVGGEPTAAGDVTPSQKPTRKELAVRARQRKLQAIVEAYRRLVDQAEEEEEEAAAAAAASSNAPGPKPAGLRRRGQAAARRRIVTSSAAPPQQQQHACKCRCRDFKAKILRRVAKLEEERKKLEDGLEERVKIMVDKHLKARRL
ncbi:uncharacterized protein LOC144807252 [Lissotriton helveticus]